jgi:hypothetical protein
LALTREQELLFAMLKQLAQMEIDISAFPPNQQQKQEARP